MNRIASLLLVLPAAIALAQVSAQVGGSVYRDQKDEMQLRDFVGSSFKFEGESGSRVLKFRVEGDIKKGQQVSGIWKSRGLEVLTDSLVGSATEQKDKSYLLKEATLTGSVKFYSSIVQGKDKLANTTDIRTAKCTYLLGATSATVESPGPLTIFQYQSKPTKEDKAAGQTLRVSGQTGTIRLASDPEAKERFLGATLNGGVRIIVRRTSKVNTQFDAKCDRLEIERLEKGQRMTLIGRVSFQGFDESNIGNIQGATKAVIELNADNTLSSIDVGGEPATGTFQKAGGDR